MNLLSRTLTPPLLTLLLATAASPASGAPVRLRLLGHHEAGLAPTSLTLSDSGEQLFVGNRGDQSVWVFDTATMKPVETHSLAAQHGTWGVAPAADDRLVVANWDGETLSVIDRVAGGVPLTIPVGIKPSYVAVSPDGRTAYAAGHLTGDVSIVDLSSGQTQRKLEVGQKPMGVVVSPDGRFLYVAACKSNKVSKVDLKHEVVLENFGGPLAETTNLAITPDGLHVLAAGDNNRLLVMDSDTGKTTKMRVGGEPCAVAVSPDGRLAFVAHHADSTVGVVELATGDMVASARVGPGVMDVVTDGRRVYTCSDKAGSVSVFELESGAALRQ